MTFDFFTLNVLTIVIILFRISNIYQILALSAHGIEPQDGTNIKVVDWNRTSVGNVVFPLVARQFALNKDFYLEIEVSNLALRVKCESVSEFLQLLNVNRMFVVNNNY